MSPSASRGPRGRSPSRILEALAPLGARCDGQVAKAAVFTLPSTAGVGAIRKAMEVAVRGESDLEWYVDPEPAG